MTCALVSFVVNRPAETGRKIYLSRFTLSEDGMNRILLRKEVIQPQVPLRLPCYDFIPITNHTFGTYLPCGLNQRLRVQSAFMM